MKTVWNRNFYHPDWALLGKPKAATVGERSHLSSCEKAMTVYLLLLAEGAKTAHKLEIDMGLCRDSVIRYLRRLIDAGVVVMGRKVLLGGSGYETFLYEVK